MKWGEAKSLVLQEWDDWAAKNVPPGQQARGTDGLINWWVLILPLDHGLIVGPLGAAPLAYF
jgi:hypothetical protein